MIGSPFPIYLYCDHEPILFYGDAKDNYPIGLLGIK